MSDMEVFFPGGKRVDASYRGFEINTDQSVKNGGAAEYPQPFHLFLASIGTCAGIYVLSFCQKRNIPTDEIKLIQKMEYSGPEKKMIEKVTIEIVLPESFPEKYRKPVVRAAELCLVKKHLEQPPDFSVLTTVIPEQV